MHTRIKLVFAAALAALVLSLATGSASAGRLSFTNSRIRATWSELQILREGSGILQKCAVTLEGSFHSSTIRKVVRALIGYISRGTTTERCNDNRSSMTILQEQLPWHVTYEGFTGMLPTIRTVKLLFRQVAIQFNHFEAFTCLYKTMGADNLAAELLVGAAGQITTIRWDTTRRLTLREGDIPCAATLELGGDGNFYLLGNTTRVSVTLI
jgi:hypothetical protein